MTKYGLTLWRIPSPLEWACFTFGIIQNENHFSFFAAMDHVHGDATLIGTTMLEANGMYAALSGGGPALTLPDAAASTLSVSVSASTRTR